MKLLVYVCFLFVIFTSVTSCKNDCDCTTSKDTCEHYIKLQQRGKSFVVYYPDMIDTIYTGPKAEFYSTKGTNRIYDTFTKVDSLSNICYCACEGIGVTIIETTAIIRPLQ